jgi:hypothetical protein
MDSFTKLACRSSVTGNPKLARQLNGQFKVWLDLLLYQYMQDCYRRLFVLLSIQYDASWGTVTILGMTQQANELNEGLIGDQAYSLQWST